MAKRAQSKVETQQPSPFLNYTLNDEEKARYKKWRDEQTVETLNEFCETLVDVDYRISIKRDSFNKCYATYLISPSQNGENNSVILTGRGSTALSSLMGALFRHYHVFEGHWPEQTFDKRGTDDD